MTATRDAAAIDSQTFGWATTYADERLAQANEGDAIGARHEDLARNNPVAAAIVDSILSNVLGPDGLTFHSSYQDSADADATSVAEYAKQRAIDAWVARATAGTRFDAAGMRTLRDNLASVLWSCVLSGAGIVVRAWKPQRAGALTGTCARVIHPGRICNPRRAMDSERMHRGFELDDAGDPVAVHVRSRRSVLTGGPETWERVPIIGDDGMRNVCILPNAFHPDAVVGWGYLTPLANILRIHGATLRAYAVAKQMQASFPVVIETDDPVALAQAAAAGTLFNSKTKLRPNVVYFCRKGQKPEFINLQFNGEDLKAFNEALLELACAATGFPYEVVLKRLNKSNLASARAALADAFRSTLILRERLVQYVAAPMVAWIIAEGAARGEIAVDTSDMDRAAAGWFEAAQPPSPDRYKDMAAAELAMNKMYVSPTTAFRSVGYDFAREIRQRARDIALADAQGIDLTVEPIAERVNTESTVDNNATPAGGGGDGGDNADNGDNTDSGQGGDNGN